jgi:hypothetical protein
MLSDTMLHDIMLHVMAPQYARVLHYIRLERHTSDKHSSLLDPFISYEENEV